MDEANVIVFETLNLGHNPIVSIRIESRLAIMLHVVQVDGLGEANVACLHEVIKISLRSRQTLLLLPLIHPGRFERLLNDSAVVVKEDLCPVGG